MPRSRSRRRSARGRVLLWIAPLAAAAAVTAAVVIALPKEGPLSIAAVANSASPLAASYQAGSSWGTGYSGQYTITNPGAASVTGWTLGFQLPNGTSISSGREIICASVPACANPFCTERRLPIP